MNGITINNKQYIFLETSKDVDCDKCDLDEDEVCNNSMVCESFHKDGYSLSCDVLCENFHRLTRGRGGYGVFKELKIEK